MLDNSLGSISLFVRQFQDGDGDAARELWLRFFPRLSVLARRVLEGRRLPQSAEDAVQDAFFMFFRRLEEGKYLANLRRDDIWRLLSVTTVQVARKLVLREGTLKRGGGKVISESDSGMPSDAISGYLAKTLAEMPTGECDLVCAEMLERLDDDLREVVLLRLAGYTNPQIKTMLGSSLRSIERRLQMIRAIWTEMGANDDTPD